MRFISFCITTLICCMSCSLVYGQNYRRTDDYKDDPNIFGENNVSLSVLPLLKYGYELNYDRKIINQHWIRIAPIYYITQDYTRMTVLNELKFVQGYGLKLQHKYFPYSDTRSKIGLYLSYGPTFQHFYIETNGKQTVKISKYGFDCAIGIRGVLADVFSLEFYGGLATNYLKDDSDKTVDWRGVLSKHRSLWFDYGTTGNYFVLGINLGFLF